VFPKDMVCLRNIKVHILHTGDTMDDDGDNNDDDDDDNNDDDDDNNNNITRKKISENACHYSIQNISFSPITHSPPPSPTHIYLFIYGL
jgi:hypothetical protein